MAQGEMILLQGLVYDVQNSMLWVASLTRSTNEAMSGKVGEGRPAPPPVQWWHVCE